MMMMMMMINRCRPLSFLSVANSRADPPLSLESDANKLLSACRMFSLVTRDELGALFAALEGSPLADADADADAAADADDDDDHALAQVVCPKT
jgi:hypothetical protein